MGQTTSTLPHLKTVIVISVLALFMSGCASHQDLQLAGDNNNLSEFKTLSGDELNPYRAGKDGRIPFRKQWMDTSDPGRL